jgi:hypothetical protein
MRRLMTRTAFALCALLTFTNAASADQIPVGQIIYQISPDGIGGEQGVFSIQNLTGGVLTPDFPFVTQLVFENLLLDVTFCCEELPGPDSFIPLFPNVNDFDSALIPLPANGPFPDFAVLTGNMAPALNVMDYLGNFWNIVGGIFHDPLDGSASTPLANGDFALIYVNADLVPQGPGEVPEPATLMLFGTGILGLIAARRRMAARK